MRHVDDYLFRYQTGVADNIIKQYVPFWSYMSNAMPAAMRSIIREPGQHMAYQRLYAAVNGDARSDEDFTQAATPSWFGDMVPIVFRDPAGRDDMWFSVDMSRIDPVMDLMRRVSATSDRVGNLMGGNNGRFNEQIDQVRGETDGDFFADIFGSNAGPILQTVVAALTQENPFTGREFEAEDDIFGISLTDNGLLSGGFQRYLVDTWLPQLRWVEKQGRLAGITSQTEIGPDGTERVRPELANLYTRAMNQLGLTTTTIDVARGLQYTEADMVRVGYEIRDEIRRVEGRAKVEPDPIKREELLVRASMLEALREQVGGIVEQAGAELEESGNLTYTERREVIRDTSTENYNRAYDIQSEVNNNTTTDAEEIDKWSVPLTFGAPN
jgi:hypothetical protein